MFAYRLGRTYSVGSLAAVLLLALYAAALTVISGWRFAVSEFAAFWYYVLPLAVGFGVQVGLYVRLRELLGASRGTSLVAASGTTSTAAMVSCCAHYLANAAPVLGAAGLVTFAAQYQVELFWAGIAFNLAGIAYMGNNLRLATKEHQQCLHA